MIFRIPTPVFGAGPDRADPGLGDRRESGEQRVGEDERSAFAAGRTSTSPGRTITGQTNNNGNDGTIARFGWKAQNKSLLLFSGEAYNVEMGITNELFPTERDENAELPDARPRRTASPTPTAATADGRDELDREVRALHALPRPAGAVAEHAGRRSSIAAGTGGLQPRRLRALSHADAHDRQHRRSRRCATRRSTCSPTCCCTTWASGWPTASARAKRDRASSARAPLWGLGPADLLPARRPDVRT